MSDSYVYQIICRNMHITETPIINPVEESDGTVSGLIGSDGDFCSVCDTGSVTALNVMRIRTA